jgi:hypothetical protein
MDIIKQASETFVANNKEITRRKKIIERHEAKIEKISEKNWWGDVLITPIMEVVRERFPQLHWSERMGTMGFNCRVPMFGKASKDIQSDIVACITFRPEDLSKGQISFETGKIKNPHLGHDAHGNNLEVEVISNIDQIINHVQKQINKKLKKDLVD